MTVKWIAVLTRLDACKVCTGADIVHIGICAVKDRKNGGEDDINGADYPVVPPAL